MANNINIKVDPKKDVLVLGQPINGYKEICRIFAQSSENPNMSEDMREAYKQSYEILQNIDKELGQIYMIFDKLNKK